MSRTRLAILTTAVWTCLGAGLWADQHQNTREPEGQQQVQLQKASPQAGKRPYQRRDTWYDFLLKQFNPDQLDYGTWIERRRHYFLEATVKNSYFNYSLVTTLGLLIMIAVCAKQGIDHRRSLWVTAEMMADVYNHDVYSRAIAHEAIRRYNEHIEHCNRLIEIEQHGGRAVGLSASGPEDSTSLAGELQRVAGELSAAQQDKLSLEATIQSQASVITEMSLRLESLVKKNDKDGGTSGSLTLEGASPDLVKHINDLQCQLYAERQKNRQLKGG